MKRAGTPQFLQQVLSSENSVYDVDYRRIYPDRLAWVRSRFSVAEIKDQKVVKVVFANMNINEQKLEEIEQEENTKNALIAAYETAKSANEAKSRFLAQVSHDIRTPMNAVIGMTAIASEHLNEPDKIADCLQKIDFSSKHLLTLINEILDMSKIEKGRIDLVENPFDLQELIREVQAIMAPQALGKKQAMVFKEINILHHKLVGDAGRIRQVLINLINNSVKYTPDGGKISVTIHEVFGHSSGYGSFVFVIEDNGIGMSSDFLKYIFIPFARADDLRIQGIQGTGLGMSIAHGIILAMQGDIRVESEEGRGSRFIVTLNLKLADAGNENLKARGCSRKINMPVSVKEKTGEAKAYRAKVLVVEDNDLNMEITRTILEENGYYVDGAVNGKEAYERFLSSASGVYQAILMDLQMPVMDGCTAAKMIRGSVHPQASSIPIIALTANAFAEDITNALASGMNEHISKPIDHQRLIGVLGNYIS